MMTDHEFSLIERLEALDVWLYLGSVKQHLADHQPMTVGDEEAWQICDRLQLENGHD